MKQNAFFVNLHVHVFRFYSYKIICFHFVVNNRTINLYPSMCGRRKYTYFEQLLKHDFKVIHITFLFKDHHLHLQI